jgi:hypothetical protein
MAFACLGRANGKTSGFAGHTSPLQVIVMQTNKATQAVSP